jgi:aldose 1-epimerase
MEGASAMSTTESGTDVSGPPEVRLTAGPASLTLDPGAGGRASSLVLDGTEILGHNEDSVVGWGCFPMVPWPGRLTGNAVRWGGSSHPMPLTFQRWASHGLSLALP